MVKSQISSVVMSHYVSILYFAFWALQHSDRFKICPSRKKISVLFVVLAGDYKCLFS